MTTIKTKTTAKRLGPNSLTFFYLILILLLANPADAKRRAPFGVEKVAESSQSVTCRVHFLSSCDQVHLSVNGIDGAAFKLSEWQGDCKEPVEVVVQKENEKSKSIGMLVIQAKIKKNGREEIFHQTIRLGTVEKKATSNKSGVIVLESIEGAP